MAGFLDGRLAFTGIPEVIEGALEAVTATAPSHFDDLYAADAAAREEAGRLITGVDGAPRGTATGRASR